MSFQPLQLLVKYATSPEALYIIQTHSQAVTQKALKIADLFPETDKQFIYEAGLLHDIGCFFVNASKIHCFGTEPYIRHIILGGEILRKEGLPKHARVAESHSGVGITKLEIVERDLPLPAQDFVPETLEEKIISFADLFFSKSRKELLEVEESEAEIIADISKHGVGKVEIFEQWKKDLRQD